MTTYYKATRPDATDFRTGTIRYVVGETTTHPTSTKRTRDDPSTYLSVSTVPTDCTGFRWPCRLFAVEGIGRAMASDTFPNKRAFLTVRVVEELPAHDVFGPQGAEVAALIKRAGRLTADEVKWLCAAGAAAWAAAGAAAGDAAWAAAGAAARDAAGAAARAAAGAAAGDAAGDAAGAAAGAAAWALVVRDVIPPAQFDALYGPWRSVIGEDGS